MNVSSKIVLGIVVVCLLLCVVSVRIERKSPATSAGFPIPVYPGSKVVSESNVMLTTSTESSPEAIAKWYRQQMPTQGWSSSSVPASAPSSAIDWSMSSLDFNKGADHAIVSINKTSPTTTMVSLMFKKDTQNQNIERMDEDDRSKDPSQSFWAQLSPFKHNPKMTQEKDLVHADFQKAFANGYQFKSPRGPLTIEVSEIGKINVPSGEIIVCDPVMGLNPTSETFTRSVRPGEYQVLASICKEYERVTAMMIKFKSEPAIRWEMALLPGQSLSQLERGKIFGYGVDSGIACFMDASGVRGLSQEDCQKLGEQVTAASFGDFLSAKRFFVVPHLASKINLVCARSGFGDGSYTSWWGLDEHNDPVCLVTDFGLLTSGESAEIWIENIANKAGQYIQHPKLKEAGITLRFSGLPSPRAVAFEANRLPTIRIFNGDKDISGGSLIQGERTVIDCTADITGDTRMYLQFQLKEFPLE